MKTKVTYPKEVSMRGQPIGTVFACGQELWIKVNSTQIMELGVGEIVGITEDCMGFVVNNLEVSI